MPASEDWGSGLVVLTAALLRASPEPIAACNTSHSVAGSMNLPIESGRGEVKGFDVEMVDTLFLRCEAR